MSETVGTTYESTGWEATHWERLQELFHLAETAPPGERTRILTEAGGDRALVDRVLALLAAAEENAGEPASPPSHSGARIGPYTLLRHLGTGGWGSVYLAERMMGGATVRCAVKLLSLHAAGPEFQARFQREQHILAGLNHPSITRMLDAGYSDTAQPYLAIEYVEGTNIASYCDARELTVEQRLRLFLQVCQAVAYAHRALTVLLDLKPSNILVTTEGEAKLLDFGTSKLMESDGTYTTTVLATPAYASPEQLRNEPVTTACDVYALGAILFELLAGKRPHGECSVAMLMDHALREGEPQRMTESLTEAAAAARAIPLKRLATVLRGDLNTIVARCLRSRPRDRYPSVDALSEDVQRYLDGRPVLARRQTARYRLAKLVRRNRTAVAAGALASMAVLGSLGYAVYRQQQSLRDGRRAVQMQTFMSQLFKLANTHYMGKPAATVPEFLTLGSRVLPQMIDDPADLRTSQLSLAESMYNNTAYSDAAALLTQVMHEAKAAGDIPVLAEAEGYLGNTEYHLNHLDAEKRYAEEALQLSRRPGVTPATRVWVTSFYEQPRYDQDLITNEDVTLQTAAVTEAHEKRVPENELAFAELALAGVLEKKGRWQDEQSLVEQAMAIYSREPYAVCETANAAQMLGLVRQQLNDLQGSVAVLRTSYEDLKQCAGEDNRDTLEAAGYLGLAMVPAKQTKQAIPILENAIPRLAAVAGPQYMGLRGPLLALARSYLAEGQYKQSEATAEQLYTLAKGKVTLLSPQMGAYQSVWARAIAGQGRYQEALVHAQLAEQAYTAGDSKLPAIRDNAALTHKLVLDLQAKAAAAK